MTLQDRLAAARARQPLPIDSYLSEISAALVESGVVFLKAPPGTGKSTRVPIAIASQMTGKVLVLEPRRLAARLCAVRVSEECNDPVGGLVGYRVRFDVKASNQTRVEYLTEGLFSRLVVGNPNLDGIACVIIDEFHERHIHTDAALGILRLLQESTRPDLKIVVMSATIEVDGLQAFWPQGRALTVQSRAYDVRVEHLSHPMSANLERGVQQAVGDLLRDPSCPGHILVFLSGMGEQRRCQEVLATAFPSLGNRIFILHSSTSSDDQRKVFDASEERKVILATNIAETSLTIDGVTGVVDAGFAKVPVHSPFSGMERVVRRPISKASAIQRTGRAGRTMAGVCRRLFTTVDFQNKPDFDRPEIRRLDLCQVLLELAVFVQNLRQKSGIVTLEFKWFEAPMEAAQRNAALLLRRLGAFSQGGQVTELGRRMAQLPLHPRLARMVAGSQSEDERATAIGLAVCLSEEGEKVAPQSRDPLDRLNALCRVLSGGAGRGRGAQDFQGLQRATEQVARIGGPSANLDVAATIGRMGAARLHDVCGSLLMAAFPDRVCQVRLQQQDIQLVMAQGGAGMIKNGDHLRRSEFAIALDAEETAPQAFRVDLAYPLSQEELIGWASAESLRNVTEVAWDGAQNRVRKKSLTYYLDLIVDEVSAAATAEESQALLAQILRQMWPKPFGEDEVWRTTRVRQKLLADHGLIVMGEVLPETPDADFFSYLATARTSINEVAALSLEDHLRGWVRDDVAQKMTGAAPLDIQLQGKRRIKVNYVEGRSPWIEAKIQDFFGTRDIPRIVGGKVPVTVQLLAPNGLAVQVTQDLPRFWREVYPGVRASLSRQYPRHFWPEDPLTAAPILHKPRGQASPK